MTANGCIVVGYSWVWLGEGSIIKLVMVREVVREDTTAVGVRPQQNKDAGGVDGATVPLP